MNLKELYNEFENNWNKFFIESGENSVVLYGAGSLGIKIKKLLESKKISVKFFTDSDSSKWGKKLQEIEVKSPDTINESDFVVISTSFWKEVIEYLTKRNLRFVNFDYLSLRLKDVVMPLPDFAQIEVTTRCNFRCFTCSRESLPKNRLNRDMTIDEFRFIISQIPNLKHVKLQGLGEPLISRNINEILSYAKSLNIRTSTISNGSIRPNIDILKNLDELRISFDSQDKEYLEKMRAGSKFEKIVENLEFITDLKQRDKIKTKIRLSAVVTHLNFKEIEKIVEKAVALRVDEIGIVEVENWYIPIEDKYRESLGFILRSREYANQIKDKVEILKKKYHKNITIDHLDSSPRKSKCLWPFYSVYISVDGYVTPCCIRMNSEIFNFGNIYEESFVNIWNSEKYKLFRDANMNNKPNIVCGNCPN